MFAGELATGQAVVVELRLPNVALPVRVRAVVRHHNKLRCGLQFMGLPIEQREMIRYWSSHAVTQDAASHIVQSEVPKTEITPTVVPAQAPERPQRRIRIRRRKLYLAVSIMLLLVALGWWQWQRAWRELEMPAAATKEQQSGEPVRLSPEIMAARTVYRLNPTYPEAAQHAGVQGFVVLDALIAVDGSVKRLKPVSGSDLLVKSALDSVQYWRFEPYRLDGKAVEFESTISIEFRLN